MSDIEYGQYATGAESGEVEQLHEASASEADYNSDFAVYEQDHTSAESTDFEQGRHVEYTDPNGAHYESTDYVSYSHDEYATEHVFAAEGSESAHVADWSEFDALRAQFDSAFATGTEYSVK
ncbi:hypothetical protein KZZ52_21175 [Dactylosporangium sp. AC04546]|uniref:hypothetical protein n=1 Tax=Dactylosporangium sp. AC04546 TaxID=2862460 RepID=UPI001EDDDD33|nr:hypothetical protein [Dactylosporangium sp. AC04546]WVK87799.1 hypothetical protein KZZ52_21175 [Dactylosporangium sp. AC04546]